LLEITARLPAKLGTGTAKIVGAKMFDPHLLGRLLND
jgi:hypothetical protein